MTVLAGFAGGLAGTLWAGIVSSALLARRPELSAAGWRPDTAWRVLHTAAVYGLCGAAAGLLFWLGWGLVAFTNWPWFVVGASYGLLLWFAAAFPALLLLSLRVPDVAGRRRRDGHRGAGRGGLGRPPLRFRLAPRRVESPHFSFDPLLGEFACR